MNQAYTQVTAWAIRRSVLEQTIAALQEDGKRGREGIVFWIGTRQNGRAEIRAAIVPAGPGVVKRPDFLRVSDRVMAAISELLDPPHSVLVGQIHTHRLGVRHSPVDDKYIIDTPGYLSVVVDRYALVPSLDPGTWGVHAGQGRGFRLLSPQEARASLSITEGGAADVRVVRG